MHDFPLITTLAAAFTGAWVLGLLTQRMGLSPIVGYLLAGILIGPNTPGFVGDVHLASQLAELGVILLMFGVGMHFHLKDLLAVKTVAIPGAIGQSLVATLVGGYVFHWFGFDFTAGLVVGMAMAVASTVVLMRVLMDAGQFNTPAGHAAVGWLIVEDLITVIILVLLPALAVSTSGQEAQHWSVALAIAMAKLAVLVLIAGFAGSKVVPWILVRVARLRSRELFTLTVLVLSIAVATGSAVFFGASVALGAFVAGMVVGQSPVSAQAAAEALPLRDAFAVIFFVAVGMLFDPYLLVTDPFLIYAGLFIVLFVKPVAAVLLVSMLGYPLRTGLVVGIGLAQVGEFSFILGDLAFKYGILPEKAKHLLVACAILSITLNPILFRAIGPFERWLQKRARLWKLLNYRSERSIKKINTVAADKIGHVKESLAIVIGYGPVGQQIDRLLEEAGIKVVIVELNMDVVTQMNRQGRLAVYGDASREEVLLEAGIMKASYLILTAPYTPDMQVLITEARELNPQIHLLVRTRYIAEEIETKQLGANVTVVDELETAVALAKRVLQEYGKGYEEIRFEAQKVRQELSPEHKG